MSGNEKYPLIFQAINEGKVILSGGLKLSPEWKPYKNGIFVATIREEANINQLYVNAKRRRMDRFPNAIEGKNVFDTWD